VKRGEQMQSAKYLYVEVSQKKWNTLAELIREVKENAQCFLK
jgi:hypothetical protein